VAATLKFSFTFQFDSNTLRTVKIMNIKFDMKIDYDIAEVIT